MCMCGYGYYSKPREKTKRGLLLKIQEMSTYLPSDFEEFEQSGFLKIMFYERIDRKHVTGFCECGAAVHLTKAQSGRIIECPACNSKVRLTRKTFQNLSQRNFSCFVDRFENGWVDRMFIVEKYSVLKDGEVEVSYKHWEEQRDYFDGEKYYSFHPVFGGDERWAKGAGRIHGMGYTGWRIEDKPLRTYPKNISRLFKGTPFEYSQIETAIAVHNVNPFYYLLRYKIYPKLELVYKVGLYELASQIVGSPISWGMLSETQRIIDNIKSLKDLGIDKKEELEECMDLPATILIARKEVKHWKIPDEQKADAWDFIAALNNHSGEDMVYPFMSRKSWYKYYLTQTEEYSSPESFISDYTDYISDCSHLGLDLDDTMISRPKSLRNAHQAIIEEIEIQKTQVYDALIESAWESMHKLVEWSDGNFMVIMPRTSREIVNEGQRQCHCVGRYCERVATGESVILFIRECAEPENGGYTVEIKKDMRRLNVVQCRGYKNSDAPEEVNSFLKKYKKWFKYRSLGDYNADSLMVTYFKAVHKRDGKYISDRDGNMEFVIGEWKEEKDMDTDPDKVAVKGLHVASMEFAQKFGDCWNDVAILEVETNIHDVIIPDAKDQVRTSRFRVVREVPFEEMGDWGKKHMKKSNMEAA